VAQAQCKLLGIPPFSLFMKIVCLLLLAFSTSLIATPPNVIIMLVDDMGVMDTSLPFLTDAEGKPKRYPLNDFYRTPNMERLAAEASASTTSAP
jgi:hypothetical protein